MTFKVGQRVRVLPGAHSTTDGPGFVIYDEIAGDKTATIEQIFSSTDYLVIDSDDLDWYIASEFLEETPKVKLGDTVESFKGDRGTIFDILPDGRFEVNWHGQGRVIYSPEDLGGLFGIVDRDDSRDKTEPFPPPTPKVKVGDRVRVTVEGTVTYLYSNGNFEIEGSTGIPTDKAKVEILEVPPKVGDFVDPEGEYASGTVAVLDNNPQSIIVRHAGIWTGNVIGDNASDYIARDRWKIIYIPEEGK